MTQESVDQTRPSTRAITVDAALARRMAGFMFADQEPVVAAFLGEPVKEALAMVEWAVRHEGEEGFDPAKALVAWAKRRKRGVWSDRPNHAARTIWGEVPAKLHGCDGCGDQSRDLHEVGADSLTVFEGDLICEACAANHGVTL